MDEIFPDARIAHRYRVVRRLGEGGMGTAYLVEDMVRGERVALKIVRATSDAALAAFAREFRHLRGLVHPHLLRVRDYGRDEGRPYYTADYIEGIDLRAHATGLPWPQAIAPLLDALAALRLLHERRIRHGDLKPDNVLVQRDGRGMLIDLSCAQRFGVVADASGTPMYIAPEVAALDQADQRADLHAVGVLLRELSRDRADVPKNVAKLSARLVHIKPEKRPADVVEVLEVLGGELTPLRLPSHEPARLFGRGEVLARFQELLAALCTGKPAPRGLLIVGPDGVGRTRLLDELKWLAAQRCGVVEGIADRPDAMTSMLQRASDDFELPDDMSALLSARALLGERALVMCLDDCDLINGTQRDLWRGWLRSTTQHDVVLSVGTCREADDIGDAIEAVNLAPLSEADVAEWTAELLPRTRAGDVWRLTGGFPRSIGDLVSRISAGDISLEDLSHLADQAAVSQKRLERLSGLGEDARLAVAAFAVAAGSLDSEALQALHIEPMTLAALLAEGWVTADAGAWRLTRRTDARSALSAIGRDTRASLHMAFAEYLMGQLEPEDVSRAGSARAAALVKHLALGGAGDRAVAHLEQSSDAMARHPDVWVDAARAIGAAPRDTPSKLALAACEIFEAAGRFDEAIGLLAKMLRTRAADAATIWLRAGATYLRRGNHQRALRYLLRARAAAPRSGPRQDGAAPRSGPRQDGAAPRSDARVRIADLISRAHIKLGDYEAARRAAQEGLALAADDVARANLHDDLGVAASYLGLSDEAREHLNQAAVLHERAGQPRAQARAASYHALVEYRAGNTRAAVEGFQRALDMADACGAADLVVYAAQNLGAASHQQGDLGRALSSYERGLSMATALGDVANQAALRCNLAKLYSDVGMLDRALATAIAAEGHAASAHLPVFAATAASVAGEVLLLRGDAAGARDAFERARSAFGEDAPRELAETWIHLADALDVADDAASSAAARTRARELTDEVGADDLEAKLCVSEARSCLGRGDPSSAVAFLERALPAARAAGQRELEADVLAWLARACANQGAQLLAEQHARGAREAWEHTAMRLPKHLADTFWAHPARNLPMPSVGPDAARGPSDREQRLERLLDINKKLNSSLDTQTILAWTIDSALELTGAERGFVLLVADDAELTVEVARNIDAAAAVEETRFSKSIAQQAIHDVRAVITVDAAQDERFERQHSIHAMQLKSVVCVPIIARAGVIGAVYLDHRYRRGVFGSDQVVLLSAFADQVAIALTNARLHHQLAERSRQLDDIMHKQAEQIEDLTEQVRVQQRALMHRYDYGAIVGDSASMQQVFRTLDRVIDSDVSVLIQGESGTGKELIARAIHYNGARRDGPMVSINCGALPETLLESELFGHVRGAFTGAATDRDGLFVSARGGTIFLDEIGEMPPSMQVKLLRVLQEQEVTPLGQSRAVPVDARVLAATNRDLRREVEAGRFREDLFYRVGVVEVTVPPLRERRGDIPLLVDRVLADAAKRLGREKPRVAPKAMHMLQEHAWPGNVRELENVITKAVLLSEGGVIKPPSLQLAPRTGAAPRSREAFRDAEAEQLLSLLRATGWNISETARRMSMSRPTIYRKMQRFGFVDPQ